MGRSSGNKRKIVNIVQSLFKQAVESNNLLRNGDRILVGLSGGVDSLVLLDLLAIWQKHFPVSFDLKAVHIDIENIPYKVDTEYLTAFCERRGVDFEIFNKVIEIDKSKVTTNPCFICSWNRRKILFDYAKRNNYNKLALGHHRDDAVETFLINLIFHGTVSSLPFSLSMFDSRLQLIRPLLLVDKPKILEYARFRGYEAKLKECAFADKTKRRRVNEIIEKMKEISPVAQKNIFKALSNINNDYLPKIKE